MQGKHLKTGNVMSHCCLFVDKGRSLYAGGSLCAVHRQKR